MKTLTKARGRPHVLDDATIDRTERVYGEQLEFVDIYAEQLRRWRAERLSPAVMAMSDLELGLQALRRARPAGPTRPMTLRAIR